MKRKKKRHNIIDALAKNSLFAMDYVNQPLARYTYYLSEYSSGERYCTLQPKIKPLYKSNLLFVLMFHQYCKLY